MANKDDDVILVDLNKTYGTTTTYWAGDSVADVVYSGSNDSTFTIDTSTMDGITLNNNYSHLYESTTINTIEIDRMCKEYPGLEKAWRNFKSVYDMVKQDYQGKKDAGEIDDDIPF